ncbi:MAG: M23 family metallopeptidase [Bacillota bacterium]
MRLRVSRTTRSRLRRALKNDVKLLRGVAQSRLLRQVLLCVLIYLVVAALNAAPFAVCKTAMLWVKAFVTQDYDFASDLENSKVVSAIKQIVDTEALARFWNTPPRIPRGTLVEMGWPVDGAVTSVFGWRVEPAGRGQQLHQGIDISAEMGAPIRCAADGVVIVVRESPSYGKMLEIDHGSGWQTLYAHCSEIIVKPGESVKQGQLVARVGQTGDATAPHLHFEVKRNGQQVDPLVVLPASEKEGSRTNP